jgi:hypothetical protein
MRWFEPTMEKELRFRAELETGIREGIPRGNSCPITKSRSISTPAA